MTRVRFQSADGDAAGEVTGSAGDRLLDLAQAQGQPLEGTCEGQMACSTCHVLMVGGDVGKLPAPSEAEEDMLDLAAGATRSSRLACQIWLTDDLDELIVRMPGEVRNMQGR